MAQGGALTARRLALALWAACVALAAVALLFFALNGSTTHSNAIGEPAVDAVLGLLYLTFPTVGAAIAIRRPGNALGWLFLLEALAADLRGVVTETVQPAHASLWLRSAS